VYGWEYHGWLNAADKSIIVIMIAEESEMWLRVSDSTESAAERRFESRVLRVLRERENGQVVLDPSCSSSRTTFANSKMLFWIQISN
jgi:hypothetical protein